MRTTRERCNPQRLRDEILSIVELLDSPHLAVFYSSSRVRELLDALYARWEEANRVGEPLDYADCDELKVLLEEARRARAMPSWKALRILAGLDDAE